MRYVRTNSCLSARRIRHALLGALIALAASSAGAQQTSEAARLPGLSFLEALGAPHAKDLAAVERGEVVVWPVAGADRDEVALVGLMRVAVPRDFYFARTANVTAFLSRPGREAFGVLGSPPTLADFASMKLDPSDAAGIRKCRVSHCSIKLPEQQMTLMADALAPHHDDRSSPADSLMREWLFALVTDYRARGDAALPVYDDTRPAERSASGFRQLLAADASMFRDAPTFASYLAESPAHPPVGATSTIFWAVDRKPGLKPILSLSRLSTFRGAGPGVPMFVATFRYDYHVTSPAATMRFACVTDLDEYRELQADPDMTEAWYVQPKPGLDGSSPDVFELVEVTVEGTRQKIRRTLTRSAAGRVSPSRAGVVTRLAP